MTNRLVDQVRKIVFDRMKTDSSGHDHHHIDRVYRMACFLQSKEGGDLLVIQLAALLHDISDHKLNGGILNDGARVAEEILVGLSAKKDLITKVCNIIDHVSYKGSKVKETIMSLEGKIVQDADRLDAMGAIGIARAFSFGGNKGRPLYDPEIQHEEHDTFEKYASSKSHTINHFYEKLLLLQARLNTPTAKKIGQERHDFMVGFINQFMKEWKS